MVVVIMADHTLEVILLLMEILNLLIGGLNHKYWEYKSINHNINLKKYIIKIRKKKVN